MPWVQVGLNLCDLMGKVALKPEVSRSSGVASSRSTQCRDADGRFFHHPLRSQTTRKLRKTRQEVSDELARSYALEQKEENGDPEEDKKAAKRKEEAKRRAAMSDAERKKASLGRVACASTRRRWAG